MTTWKKDSVSSSGDPGVQRIATYVLLGLLGFILLIGYVPKLVPIYVSGDQIVAKQAFWTGSLSLKADNGLMNRAAGDVWKFKRETSVKFTNDKKAPNRTTHAVFVRHNDGGTEWWGGTARFKFPADMDIFKVIKFFGTESDVVLKLFIPGIREILTATAGMMTVEESYTTKRPLISDWGYDQANYGVFLPEIRFEKQTDEFGQTNTLPVYERRVYTSGPQKGELIRKQPIFSQFGITCALFKVTEFEYLGAVEGLIGQKMQYRADLQVVNADIQKLEQSLNEAKAVGQRQVTEAQYAQLKIKEQVVQQAEGEWRKAVNDARADSIGAVNTLGATRYEVQAEIKEAEGNAARRRKSMAGDMALDARLSAYDRIMSYWYKKVAERAENAPEFAANWDANYFMHLLNAIDTQVRTELGLSFNFGRQQ